MLLEMSQQDDVVVYWRKTTQTIQFISSIAVNDMMKRIQSRQSADFSDDFSFVLFFAFYIANIYEVYGDFLKNETQPAKIAKNFNCFFVLIRMKLQT
jgi:hypothetical protein